MRIVRNCTRGKVQKGNTALQNVACMPGELGRDDVFFAADTLHVLTWAGGVSVAFLDRSTGHERFRYGTRIK